MNWAESNIQSIAVKRLFYFDNEVNSTCLRISKQLNIDIFPSYNGEYYFKYDFNECTWHKLKLNEYQIVSPTILIFDNEILEKLIKAPSQILFVFDEDQFKGIVHFTDYSKKIVYNNLYLNFFEFERKLKEYLIIKGFSEGSFIKYFEYKAKKHPKNAEEYGKHIRRLEKEKTNYPMDTLFTKDLLEFCYSSFHKINNTEKPLIISNQDKSAINDLRNLVMHHKDNTDGIINKLVMVFAFISAPVTDL